MKKILLSLLVIIACLMSFVGCNQPESQSESTANTIEFVNNEITLCVGETANAEVKTSRPNVYVVYSVLDTSVATISNDGLITAVSEGQTICYAQFGNQSAMCLIKVVPKQAIPMLSVSVESFYEQSTVTLYAGDSLTIQTAVKLGDELLSGAQVEFAVENDLVATVDGGLLTAVAVGETTVTISATYQGQTVQTTLKVRVVNK